MSQYKIWWDEEVKVGRYYFIGETGEAAAREVRDQVIALMEERGKMRWLLDNSRNTHIQEKARIVFSEIYNHPNMERVAIIGSSFSKRLLMNLKLSMMRVKKSRFFGKEDKALAWLVKDR